MELYQQTPLAIWNTARDAWETPDTEGLFCEHWGVYSETWPTSGMTRNGMACALPTWEPATDGSECSCSPGDVRHLPTPTSRDYKDSQIRREPHRPDDTDTLPTPTSSDTNGVGAHGAGGADLRTTVALLPTPSVADTQGGRKARSGERNGELLLNGIAHANRWGDYAAAIARHEQALGRPAPDPTEPGPKGSPRLSPAFVEWMMGLPAGWITDVPGVTRTEALRACGNGVVPQQAMAALRIMLDRAESLGVTA